MISYPYVAGVANMDSPFPKSSSSAGGGTIVTAPLPAGGSCLQTMNFQYPLKLISPSPSSEQKSVLVFLLSYGGGLVGGDTVHLKVQILPQSRLSLVTQGHTKVFKSPSPDTVTSQVMEFQIGKDGALCLLPDPVQPFEQSVYSQTQIFRTAAGSSLCLLDWVTQGRTARGEDWSFTRWVGKNEVWLQDTADSDSDTETSRRLLVRDTVILDGNGGHSGEMPLKNTMHKMGILGTLILRGELMKPLGDFFMAEFAALPRLGSRDFRSTQDQQNEEAKLSEPEQWRAQRLQNERADGLLWSAAQVRGCVVVKFGSPAVEAGRNWIGSMITREGSIETNFGEAALMCLQ